MRQNVDVEALQRDLDQQQGLPVAWLESLEALQEAYEAWKMGGEGVGVDDLFWSWHLQA